jgi:pimeloyl-ACP methyl ester carboxylesterase
MIEWIEPRGNERFCDYARRMAASIDASVPFYLGGVSLGGMAAVEIARHVQPRAIFLIASCRAPSGIPAWYRIPGEIGCRLPLRVSRLLAAIGVVSPWPFGPMNLGVRRLLLRMVWEAPPARVAWQMKSIVGWEAPAPCDVPVFQIHGRHDRMLPVRLGKREVVVDGAGHLLNVTHAERVNRFIMARIHEIETGSGASRLRSAPGVGL